MNLGCHACLFQDKILTQTDEIIKGLSSTGFKGLEIGLRFFDIEKKEYFFDKLKQYNMELSGIHVAPLLTDFVERLDEVRNTLKIAAHFVKETKNKNIIMTGINKKQGIMKMDKRLKDKRFLDKMAFNMQVMAREMGEMGVTINYHNHNWEFENEAAIYYAILENATNVKFALDIGWVEVGGYNALEIIKESPSRFNYIHLRDRDLERKKFVNLGQGDFDYKEIMETLKDVVNEDGWLIVEYETGDQDFNRYKEAKVFLENFLTI